MCLIRLPINDGNKSRYYILEVVSYLFNEESDIHYFQFKTTDSYKLAAIMTALDFAMNKQLKNKSLKYFLRCIFEFLNVDITIMDFANENNTDLTIIKQNAKEYVNDIPVCYIYYKGDDWYVDTIIRVCNRICAKYHETNGKYKGVDFLRNEFGKI